jgi:hypothetical protein
MVLRQIKELNDDGYNTQPLTVIGHPAQRVPETSSCIYLRFRNVWCGLLQPLIQVDLIFLHSKSLRYNVQHTYHQPEPQKHRQSITQYVHRPRLMPNGSQKVGRYVCGPDLTSEAHIWIHTMNIHLHTQTRKVATEHSHHALLEVWPDNHIQNTRNRTCAYTQQENAQKHTDRCTHYSYLDLGTTGCRQAVDDD